MTIRAAVLAVAPAAVMLSSGAPPVCAQPVPGGRALRAAPAPGGTVAHVGARATPDFSGARRIIRDGMAKDSVPGVAIAVARGASILWEEGFGWADRERRVPATAHTPFYLASVTKTITATAVMLLRQRGRLDLDRPANDYLGASRLWSPAWDANGATVRRLATHTSGLTTFDLGCAAQRATCAYPSHEEIVRRYGVLVWPPGSEFDYSNLGYLVLGDVVARVSGRELAAFLRDELFRPLGMADASLGLDARRAGDAAVRYSWTRGALPHVTGHVSGASSAYASVHDLARFGMLHAKARPRGMRALLSAAAVDTMQYATVAAGGASRYGLGWWVEDDRFGYRSVLAQGGTDAAQAWLRVIPSEHIAVAVLANKGVGFPSDVVDAAIAALLPRYAARWNAQQRQASSAAPAPAARVTPRLDSAFVGTWRGVVRAEAGDVPLTITLSDSGNALAALGSTPMERTGRARWSGAKLLMNVPGDLETADSSSGRRLSFYLVPRVGVLNGTATTSPGPASGLDGRVSYWVELRKQH